MLVEVLEIFYFGQLVPNNIDLTNFDVDYFDTDCFS